MAGVVHLLTCRDEHAAAQVGLLARLARSGGWDARIITATDPARLGLPGDGTSLHARDGTAGWVWLDRAAADHPDGLVVECHDGRSLGLAAAWRDENPGASVVLASGRALIEADGLSSADGVIAPTLAREAEPLRLGFPAERVMRAADPLEERPSSLAGVGRGEVVMCPTAVEPHRGLVELLDAWAASGAGEGGVWSLRLCGPIVDPMFARVLARRAASCAAVSLSVWSGHDDDASVVFDPSGMGCGSVIEAVSHDRPVFAPLGSSTAEIACHADSPFAYDAGGGVRGAIGAFEIIAAHTGADFAEAGLQAGAQARAYADPARAWAERERAYRAALSWTQLETIWRPSGCENGFEGWPREPAPDAASGAMLERAMLACAAEGLRRIALYGCGDYLRRCSEALREPPVEIIGFIDDDERRQGRKLWGYPVFCADVALTADLDAVILTAPSVEADLWRRTAWFRHARIRVLPLTARMDESHGAAAA